MAARHLIGSHSYYHVRMPLLSNGGIIADISSAESAIRKHLKVDPRPWFRCPFGAGASDPRIIEALENVVTPMSDGTFPRWIGSEGGRRQESSATSPTKSAVVNGGIVFLHSWPQVTLRALPDLIDQLRIMGTTFVGVDELPFPPCIGVLVDGRRSSGGLILAVDGGNSKTDVALVATNGELRSAIRGSTVSHQAVGLEEGLKRLGGLVDRATRAAGISDRPDLGVYGLAGADLLPISECC